MTLLYIALYFIPVGLTIVKGIPHIWSVITDEYYLRVISFTLFQAFISTLLSLIAGLPGAYLMAKKEFKGKKIISTIYRIPFVLPSILTVLGFVIFFGNNGYLNTVLCRIFGLSEGPLKILYSFKAVLLAHVFYNFPVIVSTVSSVWSTLDEDVENAAINLGAGKVKTFIEITLPRLKGAILSSCALVFLYCFSSFAIILVLGGTPDLTTAEVEIYRLGRILLDTDRAAALSTVSAASACLMLFAYRKIQSINCFAEHSNTSCTKLKRPFIPLLYLVVTTLFVALPVLSIIVRSFFSSPSRTSKAVFSLKGYSNISLNVILSTVIIGVLSALLSTMMALGFCRKKIKSDIPVLLPLATSSVILGLGYFTISRYLGAINPLILIILVHSVINTGFAYKTIQPAFSKIPQDVIYAAQSLGVSKKALSTRLFVPILKKSFICAFLFCFVLSCGELNSTLLLGYGSISTIPVAIYRMIGSYNYQGACSLGTILIIICFAMFYTEEYI